MLLYLVDHPDQLVTKAALLDAIWPEVTVSDTVPATCVAELRKALGEQKTGLIKLPEGAAQILSASLRKIRTRP